MRLSPDAWFRFRFQIPQAFSPAGAARACRGAGGRLMLALAVSAVTGSVTAFFLWALDLVTGWQWAHPELLWGLPLGGLAVGWLYHHFGRGSEKGNNLVIDEIHEPGGGVPVRMAPLVLLGTLVTHLFGGSAGREGTAVQMGGSIADGLSRLFRVSLRDGMRHGF